MHKITEMLFEREMPRHKTELEIEVILTAKGPGTGRSTILRDIETMLHSIGFVTRKTDEIMPGYRARLEGRRGKDLRAFPPEECPLCGRGKWLNYGG